MRSVLIACCVFVWIGVSEGWGASARGVVEGFHAGLIEMMMEGEEGFEARMALLRPRLLESFDVPLMTAAVAGFSWRRLTESEKKRLIERFALFMAAQYAYNFPTFNGEEFVTRETRPHTAERVFVDTLLRFGDDRPSIALNYLLRQRQGEWKIIDIYLKGSISELAIRRSEFSSVLSREGFQSLLDKIDDQIQSFSR